MLSDKEAAAIERQRREGVVSGPLVLTWVDRLLADRKERVAQLRYLQQRLRQAFRYLDGLVTNGGELQRPYTAPPDIGRDPERPSPPAPNPRRDGC
jgi:hypothetical protein